MRGVRFPGLISASIPGGGSSDYVVFMYIDGVRKGAYEAFCRPDTRIPLMYMPDGVRALLELSAAPREQLSRCIYNIAAFSPTAAEIAEQRRGGAAPTRPTSRSCPTRRGSGSSTRGRRRSTTATLAATGVGRRASICRQ